MGRITRRIYTAYNEYKKGDDDMEKGNVLVIGNSGVGKSTLINALLGEELAKTGWGNKGSTGELAIYENEELPFRLIDTVGFEPTWLKEYIAINSVRKWSKTSAKKGNEDTKINLIWFCVDETASKLFSKIINALSRATSMWPSVPITVVITKSYAVPDRQKNIEMVYNAFAKQRKFSKNLRKIIPVVASVFVINDTAYAPPEGITELIDATNELMPEGIKSGEYDLSKYKLNRKRFMAQGLTGAATTAAIVVGANPIPIPDAAILVPLEITMINSLSQIYEINKNEDSEDSRKFINAIIEAGTVGAVAVAKAVLKGLKLIPGLNLAASILNAVVAGSIVALLGEVTIYAFEQIYLGNKTVQDLDWIQKLMEAKFTSQLPGIIKTISENLTPNTDKKAIEKIIADVLKVLFPVTEVKK